MHVHMPVHVGVQDMLQGLPTAWRHVLRGHGEAI